MPSVDTHCAISKDRTGFDFRELHEWIDAPYKKLGVDHRAVRHAYTRSDEKTISEYWDEKKGNGWGNKAVVEWLFHIALDNLSTAFKKAKSTYRKGNAYNFFKFGWEPSGSDYVLFDYGRLNEEELDKEFEDAYEIEEEVE